MSRPPQNGYRNASNTSIPPVLINGSTAASSNSRRAPSQGPTPNQREPAPAMSRAERFEDEKRRIIESCFSKVDQSGQLAESYITHIRITEDAAHPSSPPPPDSPPDNKKPRLIIIAVRSTGRVRMHKARENNNGSFSIGKTWNLEELNAIESFSGIHTAPRDDQEAQNRTWAGSVGFVVTITKPYYWQAGTSKEKDFFIASAVKIFKKYTKGLVPELRGFDEKDRLAMLGTQPSQSQSPPAQVVSRAANASPVPAALQPSSVQRDPSRDTSRYRASPGPPPSESDLRPHANTPPTRLHSESPAGTRAATKSPAPRSGQPPPGPRPAASSDQLRSQSREPRAGMRPGTSPAPPSAPNSSRLPTNGQFEPPPPARSHDRSDSPTIAAQGSAPPKPRSPSRSRNFPLHQPADGASDDNRGNITTSQANGAMAGAGLFASSRQRLQQQQQQHQQPKQPPPQQQAPQQQYQQTQASRPAPIPSSAPQLPPLDISSQAASAQKAVSPQDRIPPTATSDTPSSGLDTSDAAAFGAITSFWGPESTPAAAPSPAKQPPPVSAPERSNRRPTLEAQPSEYSVDLRPAPLKSARKSPSQASMSAASQERPAHTSQERPTHTSHERSGQPAPRERAARPAPTQTVQPEVRPLPVQDKDDPSLEMPGAFKSPAPTPVPVQSPPQTPEEEHREEQAKDAIDGFRRGLGPMIKKRAIATKLMDAANTAKGFTPRPGGAAEKILKARAEREAVVEPDGINAVVPRPPAKAEERAATSPVDAVEAPKDTPKTEVSSPTRTRFPSDTIQPPAVEKQGVQLIDEAPKGLTESAPAVQPEEEIKDELPEPQPRVKRRSLRNERYLDELGIDRSLLAGKGLEIESLLDELGRTQDDFQFKPVIELENDVRRELGRVEAGSWLSNTDPAREEKVAHVEALLDRAIGECDELDGLLTLYSVELGSLNEDIAFIEAQSQGLQVQSANQKVLHSELQSLVDTMSLNRSVMEPLRYADLSQLSRLDEVESSLVKLYEAVVTMDPTIRSTAVRAGSRSGTGENELGRMAALREKKELYVRESTAFCQRLLQHLDYTFTTSLNNAKKSVMRPVSGGGADLLRLNKDAYSIARTGLWPYSPMILFAKELNASAWQGIIRMYYTRAQPLYGSPFQENIAGWKRAARKPTSEEAEVLFTHQEKEGSEGSSGGISSTARKLTVKRSQTLAKTLRNASGGDKTTYSSSERNRGALMAAEVFAAAMDEMAPLVSQEQNFIVDMFHVTSLETTDFIDSVRSTPPEGRHGSNIIAPRPMELDREMARRLLGVMDEMFAFFTQEFTMLLDWSVSQDPIQGVGVMAGLSKHAFYLQESSQEFLVKVIEQLSSKLRQRWNSFVEEQVRAIEDTKVKIHKRKGVIGFIKTFPHFSAAVENVFSSVAKSDYDTRAECVAETRVLIDTAYAKINRVMFDSLKHIAKETPGAAAAKQGAGLDDPEDKEVLNHHVLLIENMNHYIEEVDDGGRDGVLAEWRGRAMMERSEALEAYVSRVIRRPLGKLLDFLESVESLMQSSNNNPTAVASRPSYSRKAAKVMLSPYDGKEVRRGIDTLRKRIEKHFGDADEQAISRSLIVLVTKECERSYEKIVERLETVFRAVYPPSEGERPIEMDFSREDVRNGFRR